MAFRPNFYIPMSKAGLINFSKSLSCFSLSTHSPPIHYCPKVDENMHTAQKRDAFRKEKFHFRRSIFPTQERSHAQSAHYGELELMDARAIFNGKVLY